ncbi:MAG: hypothetical protein AAGA34_05445 [Pseudomonadota bacterium]
MTKPILACISAGAMLAASSPVSAQAVGPFGAVGDIETRAMVGVTIPFGPRSKDAETKPRLDLRIEGARWQQDATDAPRLSFVPQRRNARQLELSFTFEEKPRFLLNGFAMQTYYGFGADQDAEDSAEEGEEGEEEGRTTGQKILRGAAFTGGAVALLVGGSLAALLIACSSDDEGCGE